MKNTYQKITFLAIILFLTISQLLTAQDYNIYFDFNSDVMRINDVGKLQEIINDFDPNKEKILLVGHTDTVGNYKYNQDLSRRRTKAIETYLVQKGINAKYISMDHKGKQLPVAANQFYNRRVEIYITEEESKEISFNEFRQSIIPKTQKFIIPTDVDVEIEGDRGTLISIPANSFVSTSGEVIKGNVEIELKEFYSMKDFFSDKLSTISNGNLLTSGGMVKLKVTQNKMKLKLKDSVDIELGFPKIKEIQYYTFYGQRTEDGIMNWEIDKRALEKKEDELGLTFGEDGTSLIVTDKTTADKRNSEISFNPITKKFGVLSDKEKKASEKYYKEQQKINLKREEYYNVLKSNKLHFINCDEFIRDPSSVPVYYIVQLANENVEITTAALIFKNTNSYLEFSLINGSEAEVNARLPLNEKVELVVMGTKENKPYFYRGEIKLSKKKKDLIKLTETTYDEILKEL